MHAKAPSTLSELVLCFWRFVRGQSFGCVLETNCVHDDG